MRAGGTEPCHDQGTFPDQRAAIRNDADSSRWVEGGPATALDVSSVLLVLLLVLEVMLILIPIAPLPCHAPPLPRGTPALRTSRRGAPGGRCSARLRQRSKVDQSSSSSGNHTSIAKRQHEEQEQSSCSRFCS